MIDPRDPVRVRTAVQIAAVGFLTLALATATARAQQDTTGSTAALGVDPDLAHRGQALFTSKACSACHAFGSRMAGPDLVGVFERRTLDWLRRWLKQTAEMLESDSIAQEMLAQYNGIRMPDMRLKDEEVEALLHYMARESARRGNGGR